MKIKDINLVYVLPPFLAACMILMFLYLPGPDLKRFREHRYSQVIADRNGNELKVVPLDEGLRREYVDISRIHEHILDLIIRSEDKMFWFHPGVDPGAIFRAFTQNVKSSRIVSGASTITMQLARILNPHQGGYAGKFREALIALRYSANFPKKEIFSAWISSLPFGANIEGLASASRKYFNCGPESLSMLQAALLIIIPRSPEHYNPDINNAELVQRVIEICSESGSEISESEVKEVIGEAVWNAEHLAWPFSAPHFCDFLQEKYLEDNKGRQKIISTLDLDTQMLIEHILQDKVFTAEDNRITNGAALVIDPRSREVLAYSGSVEYFSMEKLGMNDGVQSCTQPGSTLKPFLYELAMERGFSAATLLPDVPMVFGKGELYEPMNFNNRFNGPVRARVALASSLNVPAVWLLNNIGLDEFIGRLTDLGFSAFDQGSGNFGLSLALGGVDVSLYELTNAYCSFADNGIFREPVLLAGMESDPGVQVMDPLYVSLIQNILSDPIGRVTGFGSFSTAARIRKAMIKTGTSDQFSNIWAVGVTPELAVGVWMGNFTGETVIGKPGSSLPAQAVADFLGSMDLTEEFKLSDRLVSYRICPLSGKQVTQFCPDSITEFFPPDNIPDFCDFHNSSGIVYPAEYSSWINELEINASTTKSGREGIHILTPIQDASFYFDPFVESESQQISVEVISSYDNDIELYFDGNLIAHDQYYLGTFVPLLRGKHRLEAYSSGFCDMINFEVH